MFLNAALSPNATLFRLFFIKFFQYRLEAFVKIKVLQQTVYKKALYSSHLAWIQYDEYVIVDNVDPIGFFCH
jgi:hypothetical protein